MKSVILFILFIAFIGMRQTPLIHPCGAYIEQTFYKNGKVVLIYKTGVGATVTLQDLLTTDKDFKKAEHADRLRYELKFAQ